MNIEKINIKNFKGIKDYEGEINGKHVYLCGANASGKSSFIDAVWFGLTGKNCPPEPINNSANKGLIEIDLGDFVARTKFKKGRPVSFELENKEFTNESEKFIKAPRSYMEKRLGVLNFDINEFFNKTDSEQVKYFAKIMDQDFSDIDSEIEEITESRRFDKRKLQELGAQDSYYNDEDASKNLIDVVELSHKIEAETQKGLEYNRIGSGLIERQNKLAELKEEVLKIESQIKAAEVWIEDPKNIPDAEAVKEWREELENSNEINEKIRAAKDAKKVDEQADALKKAIEVANDEIDTLKSEKAKRISSKINIDGLEYSVKEERFLWNGLPFDSKQINTASQLISGMKIASTLLKDLKIVKVDASLIDKVNFDKVLEWADNEGIELFVELVDREAAKLEIIVHDENC